MVQGIPYVEKHRRDERSVASLQSHAGKVQTTITDIEERQAREESAEGSV